MKSFITGIALCIVAIPIHRVNAKGLHLKTSNNSSSSISFFGSKPSIDLLVGRHTYYGYKTISRFNATDGNSYAYSKFDDGGTGYNLQVNLPLLIIKDDFSLGLATGTNIFIGVSTAKSDGSMSHFAFPLLLQAKYGGDASSNCEKPFGVGISFGSRKNYISMGANNGWYKDYIVAPEISYRTNFIKRWGYITFKLKGQFSSAQEKYLKTDELFVDNSQKDKHTQVTKIYIKNPTIISLGITFTF